MGVDSAITNHKQIISVIPARGGSKRIPGKNVRLMNGIPLIAHTIQQAINSKRIDKVFVSTDDREIADVSTRYGAEIIWRPPEYCTDDSSSETALLHALDYFESENSTIPYLLVFLQCTSPIRTSCDIDNAIDKLEYENADSVLSLVRIQKFLWHKTQNKRVEPLNYQINNRPRSQELSPVYIENGSIYIMRPELFRACKNRLCGNTVVYEMDPVTEIDIDTDEDWAMCELVMQRKNLETD